jgi:hypothetical protein
MVNIICFLTVTPVIEFYEFCKKLKNDNYDVYIFIDDNDYNILNYDYSINIVKLDNKLCEENGFKSTVAWLNNKACSRDKALYYFCKNNIDYEYIWFIEEDVFIPSINTIPNIDNKYSNGDLLVRSHTIINEKHYDWHWNHINSQITIEPPYASSMICAIRCSKQLLTFINLYALKYNNLFMDEALFNTIALQNNLNVIPITELTNIVYKHNWLKTDIHCDYLYHPIKSIKDQYEYRNFITDKNVPPIKNNFKNIIYGDSC